MASDPTDLIREGRSYANALAIQHGKFENADILNRVLDALDAMRTEAAELMLSRAELADEAQKLRNWRDGDARRERDEVAAAQADRDSALQQLAEERVTVYQFQQYCRDQLPDLDDNCGPDEVASAIHMLRVERDYAFAAIRNMQENNLRREAALAEANATIERFKREVNMIAAHRFDWDDNGPEHDEWLASLGEKRLGGPDIAYRGIQYAVMRLRRAIEGEQP